MKTEHKQSMLFLFIKQQNSVTTATYLIDKMLPSTQSPPLTTIKNEPFPPIYQ